MLDNQLEQGDVVDRQLVLTVLGTGQARAVVSQQVVLTTGSQLSSGLTPHLYSVGPHGDQVAQGLHLLDTVITGGGGLAGCEAEQTQHEVHPHLGRGDN